MPRRKKKVEKRALVQRNKKVLAQKFGIRRERGEGRFQ